MKKFTFLLLIACFAFNLQAQVRYKCTKIEAASKRLSTVKMFKARDGIVVFSNTHKFTQPRFGYYVVSSRSSSEFTAFPHTLEDRRIEYHGVKKIFDKHYVFFSAFNHKRKKAMVFYREFNVHSRQLSDKIFHLTDVRVSKKAIRHEIQFDVKLSSDNKNVLLMVTPIMYPRRWFFFEGSRKQETPMFFVMDEDLRVVNYRKRLKMRGNGEDVKSGKYEIASFVITSKGDLIALGIEPEDDLEERNDDANTAGLFNLKKRKKLRKKKEYLAKKTGIFVFPVDADDFAVSLKLDSLYINSYRMFKMNGEVTVVGTYAKDKRHASKLRSNGIFSSIVDVNTENSSLDFSPVKLMPFTKSFCKDFTKPADYTSWFSNKRRAKSTQNKLAAARKRRKKAEKRAEKRKEKNKEPILFKGLHKELEGLEGVMVNVIEMIEYDGRYFLVTEHQRKQIITETYTTVDNNGVRHTHTVSVPYFMYDNAAIFPFVNSDSLLINDVTIVPKSTFTRRTKLDKGYQILNKDEGLLLNVSNQLIDVDLDNQKIRFTKVKEIEAGPSQYCSTVSLDPGIRCLDGSLIVPKFSLTKRVRDRKTEFAIVELR